MKTFLVGVLAVLLVLVGTLLPLLRPPPTRITEQNFHRIKEGMSQEEVKAILGPPGDYRTMPAGSIAVSIVGYPPLPEEWCGDEGTVQVFFDPGGTVRAKTFLESKGPKPGALETLRWRWDRWRKSLFK